MSGIPRRWVLASGNEGKLREIRALLGELAVEIVPQGELGVSSPEETGLTFVENALLKARHASRQAGLPAIADDSGLVVDALSGAPGVRSARFAGGIADSAANVAKLLKALSGLPAERRGARFHCVLVAMRSADDPAPLLSQGEWRGVIAAEPRGAHGFGYDPVFFDPQLQAMAAELTLQDKNRVSHRGQALRELARQLGQRRSAA